MVGLKETVYVTFTCKKCGKAFLDIDVNNNINELPLKTRYCPDCVAQCYTNGKIKKTLTKEQERNKVSSLMHIFEIIGIGIIFIIGPILKEIK